MHKWFVAYVCTSVHSNEGLKRFESNGVFEAPIDKRTPGVFEHLQRLVLLYEQAANERRPIGAKTHMIKIIITNFFLLDTES